MKRGFTLIELLVSISIFTLISAAVIVNLRGGSKGGELRLQASNVASFLRQAQVMTLAGEQHNGVTPTGGFGVVITSCTTTPCSVILFADENSNFSYDAPDELVQTIELGQVQIPSVSPSAPLTINFKPPRPYICFDGTCSGINEADIELGLATGSYTQHVRVNQVSGQITSGD